MVRHHQKAGQRATLADISTGTAIVVEGTLSSDGKTLTAHRVVIAPTGVGYGVGPGGGRFGFGGRGGAFGPPLDAAAPSTTGTPSA